MTVACTAVLRRAPCASGCYAEIVLLRTIIAHARLGWPEAVLGLVAAAMVVAVARVQAAALQQSIRKARETEERARTAQAVLRSFEESGSNWLWESDESGCLAYVSPQFGEQIGRAHV